MENYIKVIEFTLNGQRYGIDIQQVLSIEKVQEITIIPGKSDYVKGVINLREEVISVIDLKQLLTINNSELTETNRILIVNINDVQMGLIVDNATDVLDIDLDRIEPVKKLNESIDEAYIRGLAKLKNEILILLDLHTILEMGKKELSKEEK